MEIKVKIDKWDIIKLKSFCAAKGTINKMREQPEEWEKIFVHDVTEKELVSKHINSPYNLITKINTNEKWAEKT